MKELRIHGLGATKFRNLKSGGRAIASTIREYTKDGKYECEKYTEYELVFATENFRHNGRCLRVYKNGSLRISSTIIRVIRVHFF